MPSRRRTVQGLLVVTLVAAGLGTSMPATATRAPYRVAGGYLDPTFGTRGRSSCPGASRSPTARRKHLDPRLGRLHRQISRYLNRLTAAGKADPSFTGPLQTSNAADLTTGPILPGPGGGASFAVNLCCRKKLPPISQVAVHTVSKAGKRLAGPAGTTVWKLADLVTASPTPSDADYVIGGVVRLSDGAAGLREHLPRW